MVDADTLQSMVDQTRRFVRDDLIPAEEWVEEHDEIPDHIVDKLKTFGYFGMTIPEQYGGLGLSMFEEVCVVCEIGYASPVFRSYFGTSNGVGTLGIIIDGTEEQRQKILAPYCRRRPDRLLLLDGTWGWL